MDRTRIVFVTRSSFINRKKKLQTFESKFLHFDRRRTDTFSVFSSRRKPYANDDDRGRKPTSRRFVFADIVKNDYAAGPPQRKQKENSIICTRAVMGRNNTTSYNLEKCALPWVVGENLIFPQTS